MSFWDMYADEVGKNTNDFVERTSGPVSSSPDSSLLGDIYSQQERAGKTQVEEAYNPAEDFAPVNTARKVLGKAGLGALSGLGAAWVRAAPSEALRARQMLEDVGPTLRKHVLTSPKEYRYRQGTTEEAIHHYGPVREKNVFGWSAQLPAGTGSESVLRDQGVLNSPAWAQNATNHETGHHAMREAGLIGPNVNELVPGVRAPQQYITNKLNQNYPLNTIDREISADVLAGKKQMDEMGITFSDEPAYRAWEQQTFGNRFPGREETFIVDPSLELDPSKQKGSMQFFADWNRDQVNKAKYAKLDAEKAAERARWIMAGKKPLPMEGPRGPQPEGELANMLKELGSSEKVGTDLSKGGTLGEMDRPWNIPTAEQSGIYDALNPGKKKYGGSYAPGAASVYDLTPTHGPTSMPDEVANYIMKRDNILHTDTPTVKAQKNSSLTKFMEWWQNPKTSDDDRRMYAKMIKETVPPDAPAPAKSAPRYQQMAPRKDTRLSEEVMRLRNVTGLRRK